MSARSRGLCVALAALAVAGACGGAPTRPIGMKEYPGDIVFGEQEPLPQPTVPPLAEPAPAFPGFIVPPAPREVVLPETEPVEPVPSPTTTLTVPAPPPIACPEDDPLAVPADEAFGFVAAAPTPETIPFRVAGTATVDGEEAPLPTEAPHRVSAATNLAPGAFRFDVGIRQGEAETVTTYQVDQRGAGSAADGIFIVQIRTSDEVATDAFTPSAPIRILPLPPVLGQRFSGVGADPLHGTAIRIFGQVKGKTRVNACGTPLEAWLVEVGTDPQTGQPSAIQSPTKNLVMTGTYAVATQFGGLVIADDLTLDGTDDGRRVVIRQASTANRQPARVS